MRLYEMVLALRPGLDEDQLNAAREAIGGVIQDHNGSIEDSVDLGGKKLAYEVDGETQGHFLRVFFHAAAVDVEGIFRDVKSRDDVIRLAITKQITPLPEHEEERSEEDVSSQ